LGIALGFLASFVDAVFDSAITTVPW
jgi:hypothetical protein